MLIVIDLSKKLVGYNLFESFIYKFKNESNLVLANNPLTGNKLDYDELKIKVQNILYDSHTSSFSLCILYDMNEQKNDPLKNSIVNNIHNIKEKIIKPLSLEYSFDKLYYFSLDDIKRDFDGRIYDDNIRLAVDFDSLGYIQEEYNSEYLDILFTKYEIEKIDYIWNNIRDRNLEKKGLWENNLREMIREFREELNLLFDKKINMINNKYEIFSWYADRLGEVYKVVLNNFETALYKNADMINLVKRPSDFIKDSLKTKVSSYRDRNVIIIHINLNDKFTYLNRGILKYRHQLEVLAVIMYLATNDTNFVFEGNKYLGRENHWEINTNLNEENLIRMLKSYNSKLKIELDKLNKLKCNEIEYEEFFVREFDLSLDNNKPRGIKVSSYGLFFNKRDTGNINDYIKGLYSRYLMGIDYANKRLRDLTVKLRIQKESKFTSTMKIGNVSELISVINKMQNEVDELQQKIALSQPKEIKDVSNKLKIEYENIQKDIEDLIDKRITFTTFVKNVILIIIISLCTYQIVKEIVLPGKAVDVLSLIILIMPLVIYIVVQLIYLMSIKRKIDKKILLLKRNNDKLINELYSNDSKMIEFVKNTYELIMKKKYIDECNLKIKNANKMFKKIIYHYDRLEEHIEASNRLIEVLGVSTNDVDPIEIDKINNLDINKNIYSNKLYCPLNYLSLIDDVKNKAIVNDEQIIDIDSDLIGFVDKFIISYDKEYRHE